MYAKMPAGSDSMLLWKNVGMLDGDLHPKPALEIWNEGIAATVHRQGGANP